MGHLKHLKKLAAGAGIVTALSALTMTPALAVDNPDTSTASATVTAGDRTVTIGDVAFADVAYQFAGHTITVADVTLGVVDHSGSDAGLQVTMSSTDLTSAGAGPDLAATGFKVTAVDTITQTEGTPGEEPVAGSGVNLGNLATTGQVVLSAVAGTGAGTHSALVDFSLALPDNTLADTYTGTLTTTIAAAP